MREFYLRRSQYLRLNEYVQGIGGIILIEKRTALLGENGVPAQRMWDGQALKKKRTSRRKWCTSATHMGWPGIEPEPQE